MSKVLVIGAGGVSSVAVHKMAQLPEIFGEVVLASRRRFKSARGVTSIGTTASFAASGASKGATTKTTRAIEISTATSRNIDYRHQESVP